MSEFELLGQAAKKASKKLALLTTKQKIQVLEEMAESLLAHTQEVLLANQKDLLNAKDHGINDVMIDRLRLTKERVADMAQGLRQVAQLNDPIGTIDKMWVTKENLRIGQQRVPLGVVGMIYESRPNVTTDAASLCFKTGNAVILRGGKEAVHSNTSLVKIMQDVLVNNDLPIGAIALIQDTTRQSTHEMFKGNDFIDVLIPRGSERLINAVKENATVPIIETGTGNCHIYVHKDADLAMAKRIVTNAKTQRPSVCNSLETLVIHQEVADKLLPDLEKELTKWDVELRADFDSGKFLNEYKTANEKDYATEFLDYILAIKTVDSLEEAIAHINQYSTKHSEAIITNDYAASQKFLHEIDSAAVYVNASTRFTDGEMFGFGAEIGISTQKLHARGPMGLEALTSIKYVIYGEGQIRG